MTLNFLNTLTINGASQDDAQLKFFDKNTFQISGSYSPSYQDVTVSGNDYVNLPNAKAGGLNYLKLYGACEQKFLPEGYTQLEYIESSGSQHIDTGIVGISAETFGFETKFMFTKNINGQSFSIAYSSWVQAGVCFNCGLGQYNGYRLIQSNVAGYSSGSGLNVGYQIGDIAEIKLHGTTINYNGTDYTYTRTLTSNTQATQPIFCTHTSSSFVEKCHARCYYYRLYDGNTILFNGIPCRRNSDSVLGMYDTVSNTLFTNAGTGSFIAGGVATIPIICNNGSINIQLVEIDESEV